jgi:sirohydrochlorin ferrochelatase
MKPILQSMTLLICLSILGFARAQNFTSVRAHREGVLLLAHGGSAQEWNEEVRHVADQVDLTIPTEVAFGMATKSTMQAGINRLVARGVTEIVAVPLFVSSHSSVIDSTAYLLGLRTQEPEDLKMFAMMDHGSSMMMGGSSMQHDPAAAAEAEKPIASPVPIRMASALDHHRIVADILRDRAASISHNPAHEVVILIAHGPVPEDENRLWLHDMKLVAAQIQQQTRYAGIESLTLRDDADDSVRNAATQQLREKVEQVTKAGNTALIVPLLLSYGGIEEGLRKRLSGLTYSMPSQALLPDTRIVNWVLEAAHDHANVSDATAAALKK